MGISSCTGPNVKEVVLTVVLGGGWNVDGEPIDSVPLQLMLVSLPDETLSLRRIQTLSLSTVFIDYS